MATCLKPHSKARNSPSRPKFVFPRKKSEKRKIKMENNHLKTKLFPGGGLFSTNVTLAEMSKEPIK